MSDDTPTLDSMWPLAFITAFLCVVAGCPPARHARVLQDVRVWQVEHIQNFRVSETNGTFTVETGGER